MLFLILFFSYCTGFSLVLGFLPLQWEKRATLEALGFVAKSEQKRRPPIEVILTAVRKLAKFNKPLCQGAMRKRLTKELAISHINITPEEFVLIKEIAFVLAIVITFPTISAEMIPGWLCMCFVAGFMLPEFWLKNKIKKVKAIIVKELPDAIDLLGLCVNAGLDFMLSLKWVVEKSPKTVMIEELNIVLQEINVGKTRRDAIKDLAMRYELPDLSTFSRTLIQADKMGTSVTEALNILSEEMRLARYRRGEQLALKAPMKMLVPLLLFIFPVVGILVAGPILLDFMENSPFKTMGGK